MLCPIQGEGGVRCTVVVVGRPVTKGTLVRGVGRALYYPPRVKVWEAEVRREATRAMKADGLPLFEGRCAVHLRFYLTPTKGGKTPGRLRGDLDKLTRAVLDALSGAVYRDDEQVTTLLVSKQPVERNGLERVEATINAHYETAA